MEELLKRWSWLHMPAECVVSICKAAKQDAENLGSRVHDEVAVVANFDESQPNKYSDKLQALYLKKHCAPEPYMVPINVVDRTGPSPKQVQRNFPVILPSELFGCMYEHHISEFERRVCGAPGEIEGFWRKAHIDDPRLKHHAVRDVLSFEHRAIPLRVHGDGAPIDSYKKHPVDCINTSSLLGQGTSMDTRFLFCGCPESIKVKDGPKAEQTDYQLWCVYMWDIKRCLQGTHHECDHLGNAFPPSSTRQKLANKRIAGHYVFALIMLSSDLEYVANKWKLARWASHVRPCTLCKANFTSECHMFDFRCRLPGLRRV